MTTNDQLIQLYSEEKRLKTFQEKEWPLSFLKPEKLAKCGFFYLGDADRVQCPFCGIVIFNWQSGDEPIFEHKIHSGRCPFINGRDVGNIFINEDPRDIYSLSLSRDVCGFEPLPAVKEKSEVKVESKEEPKDGPGVPFKPPQSLEFITYGARLASFKDWPIPETILPGKLAESGFFYKGPVIDYHGNKYEDFVTCFHCGIALCEWSEEDDCWVEHEKFNPGCPFLYLTRKEAPKEAAALEVEETLPTETSTQPIPAEMSTTTKSESVETSDTELIPVETSTEPLPVEIPTDPSPVETSTEPLPVETSTEPLPVESTMEPSPVESTMESSLVATSETKPLLVEITTAKPLPVGTSTKPFLPFTWLPKPKTDEMCCKVCLDFEVGATFSPCQHTTCPLCASSLKNCPICRANIERVVKLNFDSPNCHFYL